MSVLAVLKQSYAAHRNRIILGLQLATLALAFFATPIVNWLLEGNVTTVTASADYSDDHAPEFAFDGIQTTEWLLPDGTLGYLELSFSRKRAIHRVFLTNGHNPNYLDRAIRKATVFVYDGDQIIDEHEVDFPGIEPEYTRRRVELRGKRATRVRLDVTQVAGNGAALSEISVE